MSKNIRIIPRLDIKGPNLVKGIHLEGLRVLGKPERFAKYYYATGADELICMDVVASLYGRNNILDIIKKISREIFIPLTVGGGLRTVDDIRATLLAGADKVSLNTAVINNPKLIQKAAEKFGSSTIVVSIEFIKKSDGSYEAYTDNGRERTGVDAFEWALKVEELGAGEIMVTSIDREGTGTGFDIELTRKIADSVSIPVIACGGAGSKEHIRNVLEEGKADAVSLASILHYNFIKQYDHTDDDFSEEGNTEYLKVKNAFSKMKETTLVEIKEHLTQNGIKCRYITPENISSEEKNIVSNKRPNVAIVDYGMGNLFSVKMACESVGLESHITSSKQKILSADAVILPGVGAFGDAMDSLRKLDLIETLKEAALSRKPFIGICLGLQLLMSKSYEFGHSEGLDIIKGSVVSFDKPIDDFGKKLKVPHVGWNRIYKKSSSDNSWTDSMLKGLNDGEFMYFVHSFYVKPENSDIVLSLSRYGNIEFCSSLQYNNILACQFHPERSSLEGLKIYKNIASIINKN